MIPFPKAVLCIDCDRVTASKGCCEGCGSHALLNLSTVLNREDALLKGLKEFEKMFSIQ